jgi:hypothetical protein
MSVSEEQKAKVLKGFSPVASQIYLERDPTLSCFCKPKIMPLKSPNLQMLERLEAEASNQKIDIPDVMSYHP